MSTHRNETAAVDRPRRAATPAILVPMALVALVVACQGREEEEPGVSPEQTTESVDLLVRGARIWTGDENDPWAEAVAVAGDRIVAVGSDDELAPLADRAGRVIDAAGATVAPGFIDTHVHFLDGVVLTLDRDGG